MEVGGDILDSKDKVIEEYRTNPMHNRTVKLFRWHIDKQVECTIEELDIVVKEFKEKYDVNGDDFTFPLTIALTNSMEKIDLISLIHTLGKQRVMVLLEDYLKLKINK